ncbi:alpha/beta fold hydrolase [Vibrio maerlii]|uniref:alpha/beta fold hydrolase n=1 Tax=Vibrio maerlii TaxID=2231648 RepID=UPI000E3B863D|nr:alpha/beta fold hydrolase [Vibrio maerlii]
MSQFISQNPQLNDPNTLLNYKVEGQGTPLVLIHGLFGSLDNLGILARTLKDTFQVISVDLRNHGQSFHSDSHSYTNMAQDVIQVLEHLNIETAIFVGHSMGGKVAMKVASIEPKKASKLVVLDMAPVDYQVRRHDDVFHAIQQTESAAPQSRAAAMAILDSHLKVPGVAQFLGKSLYKAESHMQFRFNTPSLISNYADIIGWDEGDANNVATLFVKGGDSDYLMANHQSAIQRQFPNSKAHIIANTGHWLHAEKPQEVLRVINKFLG